MNYNLFLTISISLRENRSFILRNKIFDYFKTQLEVVKAEQKAAEKLKKLQQKAEKKEEMKNNPPQNQELSNEAFEESTSLDSENFVQHPDTNSKWGDIDVQCVCCRAVLSEAYAIWFRHRYYCCKECLPEETSRGMRLVCPFHLLSIKHYFVG